MTTILIVDDNASHAKLAALLLRKAGYAVLHAGDAETGMRLARERQPALILMDIRLPGLDGLSATRQLKEDAATREIPVIVQTSYSQDYPERKALAMGASGLIVKPYHYHEFLAAIQAALPPP